MRPASPAEVEAALRSVTVWPPDLAPDARYQPLPDLVAGGLAARICARLGDPPLRVGQSAVVMGLASRLWSVLVVPAVRHRVGIPVQQDRHTGLSREVAFEAMATDLILGLIRQGLAVALLPSRFVTGKPDVVTVPLTDGPARVEYLAWSDFNPTPAATAFLETAAGQSTR